MNMKLKLFVVGMVFSADSLIVCATNELEPLLAPIELEELVAEQPKPLRIPTEQDVIARAAMFLTEKVVQGKNVFQYKDDPEKLIADSQDTIPQKHGSLMFGKNEIGVAYPDDEERSESCCESCDTIFHDLCRFFFGLRR